MATLILGTVGAGLGGLIGGPVGLAIGQALGAMAGRMVDQTVLGGSGSRTQHGPRLKDLTVSIAVEGKPIARVFGRARVYGELIWASEYQEVATVTRRGGKGTGASGKSVSYAYLANVAFAVCEGPIGGIGRIWADGTELDQTRLTIRVHRGDEDQQPDALILAKEGGPAPAYRGTAYVVFENFPVSDYGNRIPHFMFEVWRPIDRLERAITAVTLIPGATEFGYATSAVNRQDGTSVASENRHTLRAGSDLAAALDELQAACPSIAHVSVVVAWFGDDLRAGQCSIRPKVERADKVTSGAAWSVAGLTRSTASVVSAHAGAPAYGGSPSDASVIEAIAEIKRRGLKVTLIPFVMMDIPPGNAKPDPYGGTEQAAYPWRGRITCHPAPGRPGTPDKTAAATAQVNALFGTAAASHFTVTTGAVSYSGPAEWSLRRFVLHLAALGQAAGGVDAVLLGSELVGLTTVRSGSTSYPAVTQLVALAGEVRALVGSGTRLTYGADWSEWFGHRPADSSGDMIFHLDPLWASPTIDAIGIDVYWPLSDWRDGDHLDAATTRACTDAGYLRARVQTGEGYDWFYASPSDRAAQVRTAITDGAYGKPWVFRFKDIQGWWSNPHVNRIGGVEVGPPTAWVAQSKPIWFTELGIAAVDRGTNEPAAFPDAKSAEGRLPYGSAGGRDDLIQRAGLLAHLDTWRPDAPGFVAALNPVSSVYGGRMVDPDRIALWTWDARPTPAFPVQTGVWADGSNWPTGHWLNGRLGSVSLDALVLALCPAMPAGTLVCEGLDDVIDGYVLDDVVSARDALTPLADLFGFDCIDAGAQLAFKSRRRRVDRVLGADDLVEPDKGARLTRKRSQVSELTSDITVSFVDALQDYAKVTARAATAAGAHVQRFDTAITGHGAHLAAAVDRWLQAEWAERDSVEFALPRRFLDLTPGDLVQLPGLGGSDAVRIVRIEDAEVRRIAARRHEAATGGVAVSARLPAGAALTPSLAPALVRVLDLPAFDGEVSAHQPWIAAAAVPWPGALTVWMSVSGASFEPVLTLDRPATLGTLAAPLPAGPVGVWDRGSAVDVTLSSGVLAGRPDADVLAGANLAALIGPDGRLEVLAFATATLIGPNRYRLERLLRGLGGTDGEAAIGLPAGTAFTLLDEAVRRLPWRRDALLQSRALRVGPAHVDSGDALVTSVSATASGRGLKALAPVQLRARRDPADGAVVVQWVRRARHDADRWDAGDIALDEAAERYSVDILDGGGGVRRSVVVEAASYRYAASSELADFGAPQSSLGVRVTQISPTNGPGLARTRTLAL